MSLIFVVWCLSGIILIFDGFPHASREKRFLHLQTFGSADFEHLQAPPQKAKGDIALELCNGKPVYRLKQGMRAEKVYDAETLNPISSFSKEQAIQLSSSYCQADVSKLIVPNQLDQWIPWSYYKLLLPFYKCYMNDDDQSVVYVSSKTGNIIQHTTQSARWSARLGAIPHWAYFSFLRQRTGAWEKVIIILSTLGLVVSISGIIVGIIRLKRKKGITPYKKFWYKWHHLSGFFFGLFLCTFILSGMISVTGVPDWLVFIHSSEKEKISWVKPSAEQQTALLPQTIWEAVEQKKGIRRIAWKKVLDKTQLWIYYNNYEEPVAYTNNQGKVEKVKPYSLLEIEKIAQVIFKKNDFNVSLQRNYDSYYAPSAMRFHPKPVYKITLNDVASTWLYIDPATGENVQKIDRNYRARRWLYRALHTFNFPWLQKADWLRKAILLLLCLACFAISLTGCVLKYKLFIQKKNLSNHINK